MRDGRWDALKKKKKHTRFEMFQGCLQPPQVAMTVSDGQFQQVSFVNNIATPKGGTHVSPKPLGCGCLRWSMWRISWSRPSRRRSTSRTRAGWPGSRAQWPPWGEEVKPYHVRNYLWIFVNAQIENPSFDSQTKETLTLKAAKFGCAQHCAWLVFARSSCQIPEKMIEKVLKTGIARHSVPF